MSEIYPKIQGDNVNEWWNPNSYQKDTIEEFKKAGEKIGRFTYTWYGDMFYGFQLLEKKYNGEMFIGHPNGKRRMLLFVNDINSDLPKHNGAIWR